MAKEVARLGSFLAEHLEQREAQHLRAFRRPIAIALWGSLLIWVVSAGADFGLQVSLILATVI